MTVIVFVLGDKDTGEIYCEDGWDRGHDEGGSTMYNSRVVMYPTLRQAETAAKTFPERPNIDILRMNDKTD